ncbi:MAG: cholesterol oxidase [Cellvibrionaceae bacterium]|jgi:cholesterol oxidase
MCRKEVVVNFEGENIYMPNIENLNLPVCFIHGAANGCYLPESTEIIFKLLQENFGDEQYSRKVIPGYGHIDCIFGANAIQDVYPHILDHLEKTAN